MRLRARPGLARFRRDGVNLHMRQSRVPEAERLGGGSRNIDDASTDERPPIHNPEDHGAAIIKIEDFDPRSHRQVAMRCGQSSCAIIGGQPELRRRCAEAHAKSNRAKDKSLSQRRRSFQGDDNGAKKTCQLLQMLLLADILKNQAEANDWQCRLAKVKSNLAEIRLNLEKLCTQG